MQKDIEKILLSREVIASRVRELGKQISQDYQGKNLLVVGILKGALVFMADLVRQINIPVRLDFMVVSSYGSSSESSGVVRILKDLDMSVEGWHVLLVEDIIDTGLTLKYLRDNLLARGPESVKICALLDKPARRRVEVQADYCGFTIPDAFVVGYGLDYAEKYRNLPDLCVLKPEAWQK